MNATRNLLPGRLALSLCLAGFVAGCQKKAGPGQMAFPPTQVVVVEAKQQSVSEMLSLVGTVAADEQVEIKAETEGVVEEINFEEGKPVTKGQLLIRLDESKLASAVAEAEANFKLSQANYERSKQLFQDKLISQQEFDQAASTFEVNRASLELKKRLLKDARIFAPFAGVMGGRSVSPGQVIARNNTLSWLVVLDPVKVEVNVPERFLSQLQLGQTLEIKVAAWPERKFKGEVYFIAPFVEPATRTALVKARVANADHVLKPGMFANLDLTLQLREQAIVIPEVAVMLNGDNALVFIVNEKQEAQIRPVKLGVRLAGRVEVLAGLSSGERVIVEGIQKVRPGAPVKAAPPESAAPYLPKSSSGAN
jgi:membrane fusion protein (multidrug efflux system)